MVDDSNPPSYIKPIYHRYFCFSNDIATFQVENTLFRVHEHFLSTYSSVFRDIFQRQPSSSSSENERFKDENRHVINLDGVTALEFESLLAFFYESWQESFSMKVTSTYYANWAALLAIAHRFKFTDAEARARREVFESSDSFILPMDKISLSEKHNVPISFIVPALEALVRRTVPLDEREVVDLSGEMVARIGVAREKFVRESSRMFASETWLKRVAHEIVKSVWDIKDEISDGD